MKASETYTGSPPMKRLTDDASTPSTVHRVNLRDWRIFALTMALAWAIPLGFGGFTLYLGMSVAIYAIAALGLQVMVGLAGQLSLGHAVFLGIGAYTTVLLEKNLGMSFLAATCCGVAASALCGLLMAQLIRFSGAYFKVATFGFGIIVHQLMSNMTWLTGGFVGVRGIPAISLFGVPIESRTGLFVLEMATLTLVYAGLLRLCSGRIGRAFNAIRQNEAAAKSIGIRTNEYRKFAITLGCAIAGLAGAFLPHFMRFLSPDSFTWQASLILLIMITVGGLGSFPGAIIGALLLTAGPEYLRDFAEYKMLMYGVVLVLCLMLMPNGIAGELARLGKLLSRVGSRR